MLYRLDLTDLEAYQIFSSVKKHYTGEKYDFAKYRLNKNHFTYEAFCKRRDRAFFGAASKEFLYKGRWLPHCAINIFQKPEMWLEELLDREARTRGLKFRGYLSAYWSSFENDLEVIYPYDTFEEIYEPFQGFSCRILELTRGEKINPVTAVILYKIREMLHNKCEFEVSMVQTGMIYRLQKLATFVPRLDDQNLVLAAELVGRVCNDRLKRI